MLALASNVPALSLLSRSIGLVSMVRSIASTSGLRMVSVLWLQFGFLTNTMDLPGTYVLIMYGPVASGILV